VPLGVNAKSMSASEPAADIVGLPPVAEPVIFT
jgi:hypothetical protein